ncbi:large ribosomal subunit protein P1-like [Myotis yumanensis]|uniref:large ribosomal subunit protein P1-like n=1 Tax=Myotis yumanensis TaxID=159337 RepID=UPI0038D05A83
MALVSEVTCIYWALILHEDEVTVTALANVHIGNLIYNTEVGGPAPAAGAAPAGGPAPSTAAAPTEKKAEAKKEESDDDVGVVLFD